MGENEGGDVLRLAHSVMHGEKAAETGAVEVDATVRDGFQEGMKGVAEFGDCPIDGDLNGYYAVAARGKGNELLVEGFGGADEGMEADDGLEVGARTPVVVTPSNGMLDANSDLLARAPGAEVCVRLGRF